MKTFKIVKLSVTALLLIFIAVYIITGYGITDYRLVESITFSILTKPVSHKIHSNLIIPFIILLFLHIVLSSKIRYFKKILKGLKKDEQ